MKIKKIILSRGRSSTICTHNVLKDFDLVVPTSEVDKYKTVVHNANDIVQIPDSIKGLGAVRNWVLDYYKDEILVMFDDDIDCFFSLLNIKAFKITDVDMIDLIIDNCASNCLEAGASMFSFNQVQGDIRKYDHTQPFNLKTWTGTIVGVIGRKYKFTEINKTKVDADYSLQCLLKDRIVWVDNRFSFGCKRDNNVGGNSLYRNQDSVNKEIQFLKDKWGKHIKITERENKYSLKLNIDRTQKIII